MIHIIDGQYFVKDSYDGSMREVFPFKFVKHKFDYNAKELWGVEFSPMSVMDMHGEILTRMILQEIADKVADEIVKNHLPEILAKIDQQAIATMCVASAGAKINEILAKKIPDKVLEIVTERTNNVHHYW